MFNSVALQLAKENKKFQIAKVTQGATKIALFNKTPCNVTYPTSPRLIEVGMKVCGEIYVYYYGFVKTRFFG